MTAPPRTRRARRLDKAAKEISSDALRRSPFTDVKVVPDSFLVSAKDEQGYPVTMLIDPNSLTVFTMIQDRGQTNQ